MGVFSLLCYSYYHLPNVTPTIGNVNFLESQHGVFLRIMNKLMKTNVYQHLEDLMIRIFSIANVEISNDNCVMPHIYKLLQILLEF